MTDFTDEALVYVDPKNRKVIGPVVWLPNGKVKAMEMKIEEEPSFAPASAKPARSADGATAGKKKDSPKKEKVEKKAPAKEAKTESKAETKKPIQKSQGKKKAEPKISSIRIRLSAFDHMVLDEATTKIIDTAERSGAIVHGPIPLPTKIRKFTVNKSTFVHKNARDQYEMRTHRRLIDLKDTTVKTMEGLQNLSLPSGVDIEIKMG